MKLYQILDNENWSHKIGMTAIIEEENETELGELIFSIMAQGQTQNIIITNEEE